ncbi:MAG: hypothetical protein IRY87_37220 [Acetobacteraceae bacterium]|nr:hypothetical protein [Acetobacteraceae bacterium]
MALSSALSDTILRLPRGLALASTWRGKSATLLHSLRARILGGGYRPELHYMRGGRTPGAKSMTWLRAARAT